MSADWIPDPSHEAARWRRVRIAGMTDRASQLYEAGRYADALALFRASAERYRHEATRNPAEFELVLAAELNNVGMCLGHLHRFGGEAAAVFQEAGRICEWYWKEDGRLSAFYAAVLVSLAGVLAELSRYAQAVEVTNLARTMPQRDASELHTAYHVLAFVLDGLGRHHDAARIPSPLQA